MRHFLLRLRPLPLDREIFSGSVDAGFILALQFNQGDLEPDCVGVSTRGEVGVGGPSVVREAERCYQQAVRVRGRQFNSRQPSGLNKLLIVRERFSVSVYAGFVFALS